jgi:large subunit ribosomal protein L13
LDASGKVAGRLSSLAAKRLLSGEEIVILNAEKAIITGKTPMIIGEYMRFKGIQSRINPRRFGPFKPRTPQGILRLMIRGMLPRRRAKGKDALRRLKIYRRVPKALSNVEVEEAPKAEHKGSAYGYVTLGEVARGLGWRPIEEMVGKDD